MKRFYLFLLTCMMLVSANAQKRLVLIEEFTNTGCGPCASWSPILDSCINYRLGECIAIKYHSAFPKKEDEFYKYDAEAQQAKVDFYHVTGVPATYVNGMDLGDRTFNSLDNAITWCMSQPSDFMVAINKQLDGNHLTTQVGVVRNIEYSTDQYTYGSTEFDASNLRLFVALIEEHIESAVPYPNGETELYYTMRKMLSPVTGFELDDNLQAWSFGTKWDIDFYDDLNELGVVAYLQNIETKEILATAYKGPSFDSESKEENRISLFKVFDTPDLICTPDFYGKAIFRNDGSNAITSATLNVRINNVEKQYQWTGNLGYLDRDTLAFEGFDSFELVEEGKNLVWAWFSNINGSSGTESNLVESSFDNAVQVTHAARLKLYTDNKPEEITWKLYNSAGEVMAAGGPYDGQARKFITVDFNLTRDDCYLLEFLDSGKDGIKGASGNGYYQLYQVDENGKTKRIAQGDYGGEVFDLFFSLKDAPAPPHRLVLFEEFTNTSCDPCAEFSPSLDRVIYERMDDMVPITYHYNFPSPQDPFYLNNPTDVMARANFYDVTGVPSLRVNGEHAGAWGYEEYLDSYIDYAGSIAAKVDINTEAAMDNDLLTVSVHVAPTGYIDPSANLRLFVAAVEERVEWLEPAANGERAWNYVMRKLLPTAEGQPIDATQITPQQFSFSWPVTGYTDPTELGIVTFVQDMNTKQVLGTVYTPRPTGYDQAAKILQVKDLPDRICTPEFSCALVVRNTGKEPLTAATLNVRINGSEQQTTWNGNLEPLAITTMRVPLFTDFTLSGGKTNDVELWLSDLNGNTETESTHRHYVLANAVSAANAVRLTIMTDPNPEEITWTVLNSAGDVVCQGGPYSEARKKMVIDLPLTVDDCYLLEFEDAGSDGIKEGRGYYMLHEVNADGKTHLLVQDTYDTSLHDVFFSLHNAADTGIECVAVPQQLKGQPAYDLQGRPTTEATKGIVVVKGKKVKR